VVEVGFGIFSLLLLLVFSVFGIVAFVVWIWALIDAISVPDDSHYRAGNKLIWVLVIVLTQVIGALIYLAVGRPARRPA
jgi:uncharacterized membrane protein